MSRARTYLDWNASAPLRAEAREATLAALQVTGNASSVHAEGRHARALVEEARESVAELVGARPAEVVFTSGATEANCWALAGGWDALFLSGIEHDSILEPARASGARLVALAVSAGGVVGADAAAGCLHASPRFGRALLSLQMANNETGVIQPVAEIAKCARENGLATHTDAVQAAGRMPVDFAGLGVDLLSLSSHKIGGPKGVGALVVRDGFELAPLIVGGGQERRRRAGTENVAAIAGFGVAARAALGELSETGRLRTMRDAIERDLKRLVPEIEVIGQSAPRLANTACVAWPGQLAETLVIKLDLAGIAASAGAACSSGKVGSSHVLSAMGLPEDIARGAIRLSLGATTNEQDIQHLFAAWAAIRGPRDVGKRTRATEMPAIARHPVAGTLERV